MNHLYYGDNLSILREHIQDESIDLVYLDPPFNSQTTYNVLFRAPTGEGSQAQIEAFEDTWHWNESAERAFDEVVQSGNVTAIEMLRALRTFLKENDLMAYLAMMTPRLLELYRVLKPTGSLYLHCDPTASHYLKLLLDAVFGGENFRNEIVWSYKRWTAASKRFQRLHDIIFFYSKSNQYLFNETLAPYADDEAHYTAQDEQGEYRWQYLSGKKYKLYKKKGVRMGDVWDIPYLNSMAKERLGYPTQKPLALLERIIKASSKEGDIILDIFCGCGTAVHAAQTLGRQWLGIDITHLAISLIEKRLNDAFPSIQYDVHGTPKDFAGAKELADHDKYQFQWWAVSLLNAVPYGGKKKGADTGIDGMIYFMPNGKQTEKAIVSVKGGGSVSVPMIRDLGHVVDREQAKIGIFVTLALPTTPMQVEATKAGFYETPFHGKVPKLQILTIAELFAGKKPQIPFINPSTFRRARQEDMDTKRQKPLF
jgi:adenine specific DNA methylase Mod